MSADVAAESPLRDRMIFNVGARRSGTFWLQRIVTAHPTVGSVPSETHLLSHGIAPLFERFQHDDPHSTEVGVVYANRETLLRRVRALCDDVFLEFLGDGQTRVAERTPLHVFHLNLIAEIYPDARFVHIIRDGRDVARSIAAQNWGAAEVAGAAREWRDAIISGRDAGLPPERYREVRYEDMLEQPEREIALLYGWLGLPNSASDLEYPLAEAARAENVDAKGVGGIASQKWRQAFDARDLASFNEVAGDLLSELGYPRASPGEVRRARPLGSRLKRALRVRRAND